MKNAINIYFLARWKYKVFKQFEHFEYLNVNQNSLMKNAINIYFLI